MTDGIMKMFSEDVMMYILMKLQVKSLLRLKCVSKTWCALIKSSTFINLHLNRTTTAKDELILLKQSFREEPNKFQSTLSFLFDIDDQIQDRTIFPDVDVPYLTTTTSCIFRQILGPCRGLIVLSDTQEIVLFNPTTRNYRLLPYNPFICPLGFYHDVFGVAFGFDAVMNDYKVTRMSEIIGDPPYYDFHDREWKVEVYNLSSDSWRDLDPVCQKIPTLHWYPCCEKFYNGAVHWFGVEDAYLILCFDLSTETFRNMLMPDCCHFRDGKRYGLVVLNEYLTLICYPDPLNEPKPGKDLTDIWLMKEYGIHDSWVKKYSISTPIIESPLVIWRDHLLLFQTKTGVLTSCDINSEEVKEYNIEGFPKCFRVAIYKENLISVPKGRENGNQVENLL